MRQEGHRQFLLRQLEPVKSLEPPMVLDVVGSILEAAVALGHVSHKKMLDDTLCISK